MHIEALGKCALQRSLILLDGDEGLFGTRSGRDVDGEPPQLFVVGPVAGLFTIDADAAGLTDAEEHSLPGSLLRHSLVAACAGKDGQRRTFCRVFLREARRSIGTFFIGFAVALVLVETPFAIGTWDDPKDKRRRLRLQVLEDRIARDDAAHADEARNLGEGVTVCDGVSSSQHASAAHIVPKTIGEPSLAFAGIVAFCRRRDRRAEDVVAEEILILNRVGKILLGPFVVERTADGDAGVVGLSRSSIYIRYECVA